MGGSHTRVGAETFSDLLDAQTPEALYETVLATTVEQLGADGGALALDRDGTLTVVASTDNSPTEVDLLDVTCSTSYPVNAYRSGQSHLIDDLRNTRSVAERPSEAESGSSSNRHLRPRSVLCVPLAESGVVVASAATPGEFDESDTAWLVELAEYTVAVLERFDDSSTKGATQDSDVCRAEKAARGAATPATAPTANDGHTADHADDRIPVEEFASIVTHELRNHLTIAAGRLALLASDVENEQLQDIQDALERMEAILDDITVFARTGDRIDEPEPIALREIVRTCWQTIRHGEETIHIAIDENVAILAERSLLTHLFENLFVNAIDHGGEDVTVRVGLLPDGFYVEDDGPGLPPDATDEVFEMDFSASAEGTGLGLWIVKRVVDAHGWEISSTTSSDGGARFEITSVDLLDGTAAGEGRP